MDPQVVKVIGELSEAVIENIPQTFSHEKLLTTYFLGKTDEDDRAERKYTLAAETDVYFIDQVFGVTEDSLMCESLEDLEISIGCSHGELALLPLKGGVQRRLGGRLFFLPHIHPDESREVIVSYSWPGTWRPFRKTGKDRGEFTIDKGTAYFEIRIVLPQELGRARLILNRGQGLTEHAEVDEHGRQILICRGTDVEAQHLSYVVERT